VGRGRASAAVPGPWQFGHAALTVLPALEMDQVFAEFADQPGDQVFPLRQMIGGQGDTQMLGRREFGE